MEYKNYEFNRQTI